MAEFTVIEIAVPQDTSTTDRGRLLERLCAEFLETQNFRVSQEVRITGMEVDLYAEERTTGERILVECKAHRANIASEVLSKLYGNVAFGSFSAGWLLSTAPLSKDAKGQYEEWQKRPADERIRLQACGPDMLVSRLIAARIVVAPSTLVRPSDHQFTDECYLLVTPRGRYWAIVAADPNSGIRSEAVAYAAETGVMVTSAELLAYIANTDTTIASLNWNRDVASSEVVRTDIAESLQNIVSVPVADHWADYRPARPEDFIGRETLQKDVFDFFDRVRRDQTTTRLLALKGPSGWGKSSAVLKIASVAKTGGGRRRTFVFAADSRAATSKRFGELALHKTLQEAIKAGFVKSVTAVSLAGVDRPFSTDEARKLLHELKSEKKVICLIFDQFEELLYKSELHDVFNQIRVLCNAVDEAQENVVVGFSWKTDGTMPPEHPAYYLWHSLANRRLELEIEQFTQNETIRALNRFSSELQQPLAPQLRRLLQDHCQGFPWLLKKLCIHVFDQVQGGLVDQNELVLRSLSIEELFDRDFEGLDEQEHACLKHISAEAPADLFRVVDRFGEDVVNQLLNKRLIIRSGPRLSVYWDIFRDYVLTGRVPYIPVTYIPQANLVGYVRGLEFLLDREQTTYEALADHLGIAKTTADNIVRDLVMMGNAEANRKQSLVRTTNPDFEFAESAVRAFWTSHVVYRGILQGSARTEVFSKEDVAVLVPNAFVGQSISDRLADAYAAKIIRWLVGLGLVEKLGGNYVVRRRGATSELIGRLEVSRRGRHFFLGESPPKRVLLGLQVLLGGGDVEALQSKAGRNARLALINLGLLDGETGELLAVGRVEDAERLLREAAGKAPAIAFVDEYVRNSPSMQGVDIGNALSQHFGLVWSKGSQRRYGPAVRQWVQWLQGKRSTQPLFD